MPDLTVGQLLVNEVLPPELRDYTKVMDSGALESTLGEIVKRHPDQFRDISAKLMRLGNRASVASGVTLRLSDTLPTFDRSLVYSMLDEQEEKIRKAKGLSDDERAALLDKLYSEATDTMFNSAFDTALKKGNPFALQVKSKARGNKAQLGAMIASPGVYTDTKGNLVPMFIRHSYADGLTPAELWAGSYGARNGVVAGKQATRKGGELGKLLASAAIDQVVTEEDCGSSYGMPVSATDKDNIGSVLAYDAGGHKAGEVITKATIQDFVRDGIKDIAVRSPVTCQAKRGICSHCAGIRENGKFPELGYNLGVNAASALSEKIAQAGLRTKHCLSPETPVLYADFSVKKLRDVKVGDVIMGCGFDRVMRPTRVLNVWHNGKKAVYRTWFKQPRTRKAPEVYIDSTLEHKVLGFSEPAAGTCVTKNTVPRLVPVGTAPNKSFYAYSPSEFDDGDLLNERFACLLGALLGDGCYTRAVAGVHLSASDEDEVRDINDTLRGTGVSLNRLKYHDGIYYRVSGGPEQFDGLGNPVKNFLKEAGMYGKYAHEKEIPSIVSGWSNKSVADLLGGLFAADGSVYFPKDGSHACVAFASTSKKLVEQVKLLLFIRFGVYTSAVTKTADAGQRHGTFKRKHPQFQITVASPSLIRFSRCIKMPGKKSKMLDAGLDGYSCGYEARLVRVRSEYIGERDTLDIEVDHPDHMFVLANGLVVSNSGRLTSGAGRYQGFDLIKALARVPENFPYKAAVAPKDGEVDSIKDAPQGGTYITVGGERIYVAPGYDLKVKQGDHVEAGDQLSDGVLDPKDVVKYKGVGEGRRYFTERFTQAFRDSGYPAHRRNVESVARALVDHVQIENEDVEGQLLPGDVTTYTNWASGYTPRPDTVKGPAKSMIGKYLEQPALHYTIGTKITKRVADELDRFGRGAEVYANANPIDVTPVMQSIVKSTGTDRDWMSRLGTTYLKSRLLEDAQHGSTADIHSTSPIPGLAKGVEFGNYFDPGVKRPGGYTY